MKSILDYFEKLCEDREELTLAEGEFCEKHPIIGWGGFFYKCFSMYAVTIVIVTLLIAKIKGVPEENF